jgi:benzoyl-CoA reductase subunit B
MSEKKYPTELLKTWNKCKAIRKKAYDDYFDKEKEGIRWAGGGWTPGALVLGLGDDVYPLTGEAYGATMSFFKDFSNECLEAAETAGYPRTLCAYERNYIGGILRNEYVLADGSVHKGIPKPDFLFQSHICCTHGKWYQTVGELEGGVPYFGIDISVGPYDAMDEKKINYVVRQMNDAIKWLEQITGRSYDDGKLIDAVKNEFRSTSLWAEICDLNKAIPAPIDEKSLYSYYPMLNWARATKELADFYEEVRDEIKGRVDRGIAAVADEKFRLMMDGQPPWSFLNIFRYLEKYGAVTIGSLYTFSLNGAWDVIKPEKGDYLSLIPKKTPMEKGIEINDRETALRLLAEWDVTRPVYQQFYSEKIRAQMCIGIMYDWKMDGAIFHLNRGCEGMSLGVTEAKLAVQNAGFPTVSYEGNMGDVREFDESMARASIDAFLEAHGLSK